MILYEYPFNERIRTYLRLEQLCHRLSELTARSSALDHHFALSTLFEIMDVGARADLKSDLLKDLEKNKQTLSAFRGNPAIAEQVLDDITTQLDHRHTALNNLPGKIGQNLTENDWLMSIRSRIGIPGGTCEFDLPSYHAWQQHPDLQRRAELTQWSASISPLAQAIHLLLRLLRDSGAPQKIILTGGKHQQNLPQGRTFQLLRLAIDPALDIYPEIGGNRLIVSIRLMRKDADQKGHPIDQDVPAELALCA